jgi:protein-disulfide isomerase
MSLLAVGLALVSELLIHSLCIMCSASWAISFALLGISIALTRRTGGLPAAVRADLAAVAARPFPIAAGVVVLVVVAAGLVVANAVAPAPAARPSVPGKVPVSIGPPGSVVVYEYSDYLCPFCARVHKAEKGIASRRPDVRIVKRHFPLDASCNPRLKRTVHEGSCDLARGAICAEKLGRFEAYEDAAFASQEANPGVEALAAQCGLDLSAFQACLSSPETEMRLKEDIHEGIAAGVAGTPSYQYQGKLLKGTLPPELGGE